MTTSYQAVGPHAQTLFLGCSVTEASMTLAWGSESSTCDVKLVNDYVAHHRASPYGPLDTVLNSVHMTIDNSTPSSALAANAKAQQYLKPIINYEEKKRAINVKQDGASSVPLVIRDIGKKCWDSHSFGNQPFHWMGSDPGFLGINFYIIGCPCKFRFENLSFTGFINKWTYDNNIFNVTITGPGSLLKGCRLILNEYYGSVSSLMPFTSAMGNPIAVPYSSPSFDGGFNAQIAHGNIPNLFNIFGWLQNQYMGFAKVTDTGVSAAQIYDALVVLLGGGQYSDFVDENGDPVPINANGITCNKFSPFGGIVSRSPLIATAGQEALINTSATRVASSIGDSMELTKMGLLRTVNAIDDRHRCIFKLDLSNVPRPDPNIFLPLQSHMGLDEFIDFCCRGAGRDWSCKLVADVDDSPYTGRIVINTYNRQIQYRPRVIRDFITNFNASDNVVSYDIGEEFKSDQPVRKVVIGGSQERVVQLMSNTVSKYNGSIYHAGSNVFTPRESWIITSNLNNGSPHNIYREPLADVQRVWDTSQSLYRMINGAVTAQSPSVASENLYQTGMHNSSVLVGSYYTTQPDLANIADPFRDFYNSAAGLVGAGLAAYPVHLDLISQYFGMGSDGFPRRVFYDRRLRQLKVNVPISDILSITSIRTDLAQDGYITIWENEIRAALAGVWIEYIGSLANVNIWTPTARLIASYAASDNNPIIQQQVLAAAGIIPFHGALRWSIAQGWGIFGPFMSRTFTRVMQPVIEGLAEFLKTELGSHYGKSYLLRMPNAQWSRGFDGKIRYDYEITDSGWEEPGNMLDDSIVIDPASVPAALLSEDNGKFGPILGWHSSAEMAVGNPIFDNQGPLSNFSSKALSKNTNVYYTLVADGDNVVVKYAPINYKQRLTSQPVFNDAFNRPVPSESLFKTYKKVAMGQINKNSMFYDNFLKIQYALITSNSMVSTEANTDLGRVLASDYYLARRVGQETATYSAAPDLRYQQIEFMNQAVNRFDPGGVLVMSDLMLFGSYAQFFPRAVAPCFAAVPVKYNRYCYGPWSSSPGEIANIIFPETNSPELVNNIVGGVEVEINSSYVPWEYGGMDALDSAVLTELGSSNEYQQIEETGRITLAGIMLNDIGLGERIVFDGNFGPLCNSISLNFGNDGTKTTYFFRTFSRKLGYFNKENADNIKNNSKKNMELRSQIAKNLKG